MPSDLHIIKEIEAKVGKRLEKLGSEGIIGNQPGYISDGDGRVTRLNLASLKLTDISFLKKLPHLKELILRGTSIHTGDIEILRHLKELEYLDLSDNRLTGELSALVHLKLTHLSLRKNSITDVSILKKIRNLRVLNLSENQISDISSLKYMHYLTRLLLDFNKITVLPEEVKSLPNLKSLSLNGNPVNSPFYSKTATELDMHRDYLGGLQEKRGTSNITKAKENTGEPSPMSQNVIRNKIFLSYARADENWVERVKTHLKALEHEVGDIDVWSDKQILGGMKWLEEIEKALNETKIGVLFISADFLASNFINRKEIPPLLEAAQHHGAVILPLILKPCRFKNNKKLSQFKAINDPETEVLVDLPEGEQEKVLLRLTDRIADILTDGKGKSD